MEDETLDNEASTDEVEQPSTEEAVSDETVDSSETSDTEEAVSASTEQPDTTASRLYAGKYKSPEELEKAFINSQSEASRMAGELAATKRTATPSNATSAEPRYKQLQAERGKWIAYSRQPNLSDAERYNAQDQIQLHTDEIAYERSLHDLTQRQTKDSALQSLESESLQFVQQYKNELTDQSTPLYQAASVQLKTLLRAGYPENDATRAMAVAYAAIKTQTVAKAAVSQDRGKLLKTLNNQAKKAIVAGAGGQSAVKSSGITAKDIDGMSEKEFAKYERELLGA